MAHDPSNPKACTGCRHLRYRPDHLDTEDKTVIPAFAAPGSYVCRVFGTIGPADVLPQPRTRTCKDPR